MRAPPHEGKVDLGHGTVRQRGQFVEPAPPRKLLGLACHPMHSFSDCSFSVSLRSDPPLSNFVSTLLVEICFHLYYIEDYSHEREDRGRRSVEQSDRIKPAKKAKKEAKKEPDGQNAPEDHGGGVVSPRFGQAITSRGI